MRFYSGFSGQPSYRSKRLVDFCPSCLHLPPCPCWAYPPETTGAPAEVVEKTAGACERRPAHVRGKRTDLGEKTALVWYACAPSLRLPALLWLWVCTHCVSGHPRCCRYGVGIRFSFINLPLFRLCRVHLLQKDYRLTAGRRAGLLALLAPLSRFSTSPPLSTNVSFLKKEPFPKKISQKNFPKKFSKKNKRGVAVQEKYIIKKKMSYRTRTYTEKRNQRANAIIAY